MTDKKKLLFVTIRLNSGGAERSLLNLLSMLSPEKYDIDLLLFKREGEFIDQIPPHVRLLEPPEDLKRLYSPIAGSGRYLPAKVLGTALGKLMEPKLFEGRYYRWHHVYRHVLRPLPGKWDVAIAYLEGEPTYYVADFVDAKTKLCWVHSDYSASPLDPRYDAPAFEKMDHIITISAICLDALRKAFPQFADKMHVLENISASSIVQGQARAFVPEEFSDGFNILSVGRLAEVKGFDFAIDAAALLKEQGIGATVLDMYCVKPLDVEGLLKAAKGKKVVVSVEEHSPFGGLGSMVSQVIGANDPKKVINLALPDAPVITGTSKEVFDYYGLNAEGIARTVKENL